MDLLGKQGENAVQRIRELENRLDNIESHLDAVDSGLQDFVDNYSRMLEEELQYQEDEMMELQKVVRENMDNESQIEKLENKIDNISSRLSKQEEEIQGLIGSDLEKNLSEMIKSVKRTRKVMHSTSEKVNGLEERLDQLESELYTEINKRDFEFDEKLDEDEFEERESELEKQIKKLRTSVVFLADELDKKDEVEVE